MAGFIKRPSGSTKSGGRPAGRREVERVENQWINLVAGTAGIQMPAVHQTLPPAIDRHRIAAIDIDPGSMIHAQSR